MSSGPADARAQGHQELFAFEVSRGIGVSAASGPAVGSVRRLLVSRRTGKVEFVVVGGVAGGPDRSVRWDQLSVDPSSGGLILATKPSSSFEPDQFH